MLKAIRYLTLLILALFLAIQCTGNIKSLPSHHEPLKELSWLIGSWQDHDHDVDFSTTFAWVMDQNYIKQNFTLTTSDHKPLNGEQYIGWDPVRNEVRSWAFDNDGGYGQARWSKDGPSWYVTMSYTLADGTRASATHVFTHVDDATYTFSSLNRDINGSILPDIGPFTNKRIQPEVK